MYRVRATYIFEGTENSFGLAPASLRRMQTLSLLTLSLSLQRPPLLERRVAPPLSLGAAAFGRRHLLSAVPAAAAALSLSQLSAPATAAAGVPTQQELGRLAQGYSRLQYLLQNWEKLTTVCIKGCVGAPEQCGCIRDPVIVQSYMGFKSMEDPLFKADQLMIRAQQLVANSLQLCPIRHEGFYLRALGTGCEALAMSSPLHIRKLRTLA